MSTYLKIKLTIKTGSVCPKVCDGIEIKLIDNKIKNKKKTVDKTENIMYYKLNKRNPKKLKK